MEHPQVRPGRISAPESMTRLIALFANAAQGTSVVQLLVQLGVPSDRLAVTPPDEMEGGKGMILSIPCPDEATLARAQAACRSQGARMVYQLATGPAEPATAHPTGSPR